MHRGITGRPRKVLPDFIASTHSSPPTFLIIALVFSMYMIHLHSLPQVPAFSDILRASRRESDT